MASGRLLFRLNICTSCLLALTTTFAVVFGQNNVPNNVGAPTECENYRISFGGSFSQRYYTCCKEPASSGTPSPCKQEPISNFQCEEPNEQFKQVKDSFRSFDCNGNIGQQNALKRCTSRWGWLEQGTSETCSLFSECFAGACDAEVALLGSSISGAFCGDGRCDAAIEDVDSCPLDCCPYERPDRCQIVNNTCPDECCGHYLCCDKASTGGSVGGALSSILLWTVVGIAGFVVLINICCCVICICCAKCCKRNKHDKKGKKGKGNEMSTKC